MKFLYKNETRKLIDLPPGKKPVRCQWIYMIKYMVNDIFEHFKTRLMVKSYTQTYRNDYIFICSQDQHNSSLIIFS